MSYPFVQAYHDLGTARGPRLAMVWHMAEGGGTVGFLSRKNANGVSVHFVIENNGSIVQMLRLDHMHTSIRTSAIRLTDDAPYQYQGETITYGRTAAKAALGPWADTRDTLGPNHATVAVEVEGFADAGPNMAQTAAIERLAIYLGLGANLGHRDFAAYKGCPGHRFPWPSAGGHGKDADVPGMKLTKVSPLAGKATIDADGPVWRVVDDQRVEAHKGADWIVLGSCLYHGSDPGYMIRANAADGELHVVARSRVTFAPAPVIVDCVAAIKADRAKAHIVYS